MTGESLFAARRAPCRDCGHEFKLRKVGRIPWHRKNRDSRRVWAGESCYGSALRPRKKHR